MADKNQISWTASEYIDHHRGAGWYLTLLAGTVVLAIIAYVLLKDVFATVILCLLGLVVAIGSKRKPQLLTYVLDDEGIKVGEKDYAYSNFYSFAIIEQGVLKTLELFPNKRFAPPLSVYFEAADEDEIVKIIGEHLPLEQRSQDRIDALSRRLKL